MIDNFTKIPNIVMDKLSRTIISGQASMCLHVIMRKTFGFNKESDWISLSQFAEATGMKPSNISPELSKLIKMNIIIRSDKKCYKVNTDVESWGKLSDQIIIQSDNGIIQTDNDNYLIGEKKLSDRRDTKETNKILQKKLIQKKETALFSEDSFSYQTAHELKKNIEDRQGALRKQPDMQRWAKHIDLLIRVDQRKEHEVIALIEWLFHSEGRNAVFWRTNILSTESLRHKWDKLVAAMVADVHVHKQETKVWSDL